MNKYIKSILNSQSGYASFVITLVTIILVSLIVVAFATNSRSDQKNTLGNTLATQAYYAAESGINDAFAVVQTDINHQQPIASSTSGTCTPNPYVSTKSNYLNNGGQVQYSCLVVNATPNSLGYQDVAPGQGQTIPITTSQPISYIDVSWEYQSSSVNGSPLNFSSCPSSQPPGAHFPTAGNYTPASCGAGVLQLDVISASNLSNELANIDLMYLFIALVN